MNDQLEQGASGAHVLVVEDSPIQAELLRRLLSKAGYRATVARDGAEGLHLSESLKPDLVISDISMPVMDGFELCRNIRQMPGLHSTPVILLTSLSDLHDVIRGLNAGADNYVTKPYDNVLLLERIQETLKRRPQFEETKLHLQAEVQGESISVRTGPQQMLNLLLATYRNAVEQNKQLLLAQASLTHLNNTLQEEVERKTADLLAQERSLHAEREQRLASTAEHLKEIHQTMVDTISAIASTVELRDPYTAGHQKRVASLAVAIARHMGFAENALEPLELAGVVHDVGKISIPAEILSRPGRLSDIEMALVRTHAQVGFDILNTIRFPWPVATIAHQHHERMDGSGYPLGLVGEEILIEARILAVADVFESMSSHRPYRPALGNEIAIKELQTNSVVKYDADVVEACIQVIEQGLWKP